MKFVIYIPEGRYLVEGKGFSTYMPSKATQYDSHQQAHSIAKRWNGAEIIQLNND